MTAGFHVFRALRALRAFEREQLHSLRTVVDHDLVREIGYHQELRRPLTQKQLFLLGVGSIATVQRRLRRLRRMGIIRRRRCAHDRRAVEFTLSAKLLDVFARYGELLRRSSAQG